MSPSNSDSIMILLFPPGCGGNHLANLLSLHDQYQKRIPSENYAESLLNSYVYETEYNHHIGSLENLRNFVYPNSLEELKSQPGVPIICSHIIEYYNFIQFDSRYDVFTNWSFRDIIVFTFPNENSIAYKRFYPYRYGESIDNNDPVDIPMSRYKTFYDPNVIIESKQFNCYKHQHENLRKVIQFDTETFMNPEGFQYAQNFFQTHYDIVIPDNGRLLHKIWYKKISAQIY